MSSQGSCFTLHEPATWDEAARQCKKRSSILATVMDSVTSTHLFGNFIRHFCPKLWYKITLAWPICPKCWYFLSIYPSLGQASLSLYCQCAHVLFSVFFGRARYGWFSQLLTTPCPEHLFACLALDYYDPCEIWAQYLLINKILN